MYIEKKHICLVIIYNHRYDKNISRLESIYEKRFSTIFHLMPFYDGDKENVIPVYENSHRFQGYITQSYQHLLSAGSDTYVFAADDLILNPLITEENILDSLELAYDVPYINGFSLCDARSYWSHICKAALMELTEAGSEGRKLLPDAEEAKYLLEKNGFKVTLNKGLHYKALYRRGLKGCYDWLKIVKARLYCRKAHPSWMLSQDPLFARNASLPYPLIGGYSDFFVVPKKILKYFAHLCGIFASMNVFVETAIPTALNLSSGKCTSALPDSFRNGDIWDPNELEALCSKYKFSLSALLDDFPENKLYIHPIKLSRWK